MLMARHRREDLSSSSRVMDFVTNGQPVCDFLLLLVHNSDCGLVLHRLGETVTQC